MNSDGAVSKLRNSGGGGAVLRDHDGAFRAGVCHFFPNTADPAVSEILACRRGVQLAVELGIQRVHLELDCQAVVQQLLKPERCLSAVGPWIQEIKSLLNTHLEYRVDWVRRSANVAAHKLAKVGVGDELCKVWLGSPPDFVLPVIADDIPSYAG